MESKKLQPKLLACYATQICTNIQPGHQLAPISILYLAIFNLCVCVCVCLNRTTTVTFVLLPLPHCVLGNCPAVASCWTNLFLFTFQEPMRFLCAHACTHLDRLQPSQLSADHLLILPTNILNLPLQLYQCPLHNLGALPPHRNQHFLRVPTNFA